MRSSNDSRRLVSKITSIKPVGKRRVWDLTVEDDHSYLAGGLFHHNSAEPNLQNLRKPGKDPYRIRDAFTAEYLPGEPWRLVVADYAQLEMRIMAHLSGDEKMIAAIRDNVDLHCLTVAEMSGGAVTYDMAIAAKKAEKDAKSGKLGRELTFQEAELIAKRDAMKAVGFGIIYGIGGKRLAHNLTRESGGSRIVTEQEGWSLIDQWLGVFPGVQRFIEATKKQISREGHVKTLLGRPRRFGNVAGKNRYERMRAERQGVNATCQGGAADIAACAMLRADGDRVLRDLGATMLLQVHDELVFECPDSTAKQVAARVKEIMEDPFDGHKLSVPLEVEVGIGWTWGQAK